VTYSLADNAGGRFAINAATGVVTLANSALLDYETAATHTVVVQASDGAGGSSTRSFSIAVNPSHLVDANSAANAVAEGAALGTPVGITAFLGTAVNYSLTDD